MIAPIVRIALRYGVGALFTAEVGHTLAGDPDIVMLVAAGVGVVIETSYAIAKRKGWAT